ncbi:MAG: hypothetical protein ABTQ28_07715, partial [Thauera sp.]
VLTMTYASFDDLLNDLRRSGSACAMQARRRGLTGRSTWAATRAAYAQCVRSHAGQLPQGRDALSCGDPPGTGAR